MKSKLLNFFLLAFLIVGLSACGGNGEKTEGDTTEDTDGDKKVETVDHTEFRKSLKAYIKLKDALVSSDVNGARIAAKKLAGTSEGELSTTATTLYDTDDLAKQRELFSQISEMVYNKVKANGGNEKTVYKQFCPMAFDNKGAYWLSEEETIKNPYFGDEMMNCGEVQETFEGKAS